VIPVETPSKESLFGIVGIGASAGGLDALQEFFTHLPADTGIAFVVIQHLEPHHESMLAAILSRFTQMKVVQVTDDVVVEPDRVYVIPPNKYLSLSDGTLCLTAPEPQRMPVDFFFGSLARSRKERSIGVILSGTGADGTLVPAPFMMPAASYSSRSRRAPSTTVCRGVSSRADTTILFSPRRKYQGR
jgi:two-component system CheB/CheR fusion protein